MIFSINSRFSVDTEKNTITDKSTNQIQNLEYRLMAVLRLLINANGEIVKREQIIQEVWDNYPGGDEGLNQAISHLRKYLEDNAKKVIRTIPKKGYALIATIEEEKNEAKIAKPLKWETNRLLLFLIMIGLIVLSFLIYQHTQALRGQPLKEIFLENQKAQSRLDSIHQAENSKKYEDKK